MAAPSYAPSWQVEIIHMMRRRRVGLQRCERMGKLLVGIHAPRLSKIHKIIRHSRCARRLMALNTYSAIRPLARRLMVFEKLFRYPTTCPAIDEDQEKSSVFLGAAAG
ncbi:MAG: hypothetical protein RMJ55_09500 [Roseiflexaceae bacterium]|nr:hypothetical protein [Roseiflexus sp.]MDW8213781.1 hypothetical protein [Roseiflexaceae bacterium]